MINIRELWGRKTWKIPDNIGFESYSRMLYNKILENLGIFNFIENSVKRQLVNIRNNAPQFDKSWGSRDSSS